MTDAQKAMIPKLRDAGLSYVAIANTLKVSVNAVKSYCRRNSLSVQTPIANVDISSCPQCGQPIAQISGRKAKRFCSTRCRSAWWNAHRTELRGSRHESCAHCGRELVTFTSAPRTYCSRACYFAARFGETPKEA